MSLAASGSYTTTAINDIISALSGLYGSDLDEDKARENLEPIVAGIENMVRAMLSDATVTGANIT